MAPEFLGDESDDAPSGLNTHSRQSAWHAKRAMSQIRRGRIRKRAVIPAIAGIVLLVAGGALALVALGDGIDRASDAVERHSEAGIPIAAIVMMVGGGALLAVAGVIGYAASGISGKARFPEGPEALEVVTSSDLAPLPDRAPPSPRSTRP